MSRVVFLVLLVASTGLAHALTFENQRVDVTLVPGAKDPFRIRGQLADVDLDALAAGPVALRFGALAANIPAGALRRHGSTFKWRSFLLGVKKVTIKARKSTLDVVGGGIDLGDLPGPVTLGLATAHGVTCSRVDWTSQIALPARGGRRIRKVAAGPLPPCFTPPDGSDHTPPHVLITTPTPLDGATTAAATVTLGGTALDDSGVAALSWSSDRGGGASVVPDTAWTIADVPLSAGDNRITVTATDPDGNVGSDAIDVTYNTNGIVFDGVPVSEPDGLFVGTPVRVAIREGIASNPDLDPASVQLEEVAADGSTSPVTPLKDDGDLDAGDKIEGDGIWTGEVRILADAIGVRRFRASARTLSQPGVVAWSPIVSVPTVEHVSQQQLDAAILLANDARALFAGLSADGADPEDALAQVVMLANVDGARAAGASQGGLGAWWVTEDGILGGMLAYDTGTRRGGAPLATSRARRAPSPPRVVRNPTPPSALLQVGTRRSLILAPYFAEEEPLAVDGMLRAATCPLFQVDTFTGTDASAERFKHLEDYGVILVASHGDTLFDGVGDAYLPEWDWNSSGAQTVVLTGTTLSVQNRGSYERDLRLGRMAVFPDGIAGVLPNFVTRYSIRLPGSLVYVGSCRSSASQALASALFERGAATYVGYDGYVESAFAGQVGTDFFANLIAGKTTSEAITPGLDDGGSPPSSMVALGRTDASLTADPVVNGSFEITSGFEASVTGFTVTGDGRIVGSLGSTLPTEGKRMALVSTGLGLTTTSGTFAQPVCMPPLPPGATKLTLYYDWDFFSEEFLEYCGSQFQDSFEVSFGGNSLQSTKVDDLCGIVTPADVAFDQGGVYKTGWITQAVDVTAYAGITADLKFGAKDVGDSIYDTAILVDNVRVVAEP